jgi:hypothetical protein
MAKLQMVITEFILWKKNQTGKWIKYAGVFPFDPASLSYQRAIRLIRNGGWMPFSKKSVPGIHDPLDINQDSADISGIEKLINSDVSLIEAGKAFSDFCRCYNVREKKKKQSAQDLIEFENNLLSEIRKRALEQAIADYRDNKPIPPHLVNEVVKICTKKQQP